MSFPRICLPLIVLLGGAQFRHHRSACSAVPARHGQFSRAGLLATCRHWPSAGARARAGHRCRRGQRVFRDVGHWSDRPAVLVLVHADRVSARRRCRSAARSCSLNPMAVLVRITSTCFVSARAGRGLAGLARLAALRAGRRGRWARAAAGASARSRTSSERTPAEARRRALGKAYRLYPSRWARLAEWLVPGRPATSCSGCCATSAFRWRRASRWASSAATARARARCSS